MLKHLVLILALCGFTYNSSAEEMSLEDTIAEVNDSVVSIVADNAEKQALGAGFIVSGDGYVVTNAHVVGNSDKITVITTEDEQYSASLVGTDVKTDIALLKVDNPLHFQPVDFADSDLVRTGNSVFAIGNPFGLGNSVSLGIISAKERDIEKGPYDNFIQTDASINQGNSGGPLFNTDGEVVGMNTAIFSIDGNNMGVGFATPSNIVQWVVDELKKSGKIERGWIGIGVQKVRVENAEQKNNLVVTSMSEDSPAAKAGIKAGDILLKAGNMELDNPRVFSLRVSQTEPKTELPITVLRDGEQIELKVTVARIPEEKTVKAEKTEKGEPESSYRHKFGTEIEALDMTVSYDEKNQEVVIDSVGEQSEAAAKGIREGDKFKTLNGHKIFGIEDLSVKIKEASVKGQVILQFVSEDGFDTITLNLKDSR
ncbi:MAG: trypsin-like peptidase domain-containing protein [Alphaproteobacteria bacterium]|nr:trypsin-like peptidase domain-containing protein [Alphaproteobacteria bacterium]